MKYIKIGKIVNTFGIKGELKIKSFTDFDEERFSKGNKVYILADGEYLPVRPISSNLYQSGYAHWVVCCKPLLLVVEICKLHVSRILVNSYRICPEDDTER